MKQNLRIWLKNELELWVAEGLIRREQADAIRARYPEPPPGAPWSVILFAGFGAVMFGLGVILILAFNWEKIHKFGKLGLVFAVLLAAHAGGLYLRRAGSQQRALGDALHLLGTMLFGAGIWLVAQIYHINEHWPNAIIVWAVGALALAWALPSVVQGAVAVVLLCVWTGGESCSFQTGVYYAPLLILLGVGLLAWVERSLLLLVLTVPAYILTQSFCLGPHHGTWIVPVVLMLGAVMAAGGEFAGRDERFPAAGPVLRFYGLAIYLIGSYVLTFSDAQEEYWRHLDGDGGMGFAHWLIAGLVAILLWVRVLSQATRESGGRRLFATRPDLVLVPLFFGLFALLAPVLGRSWSAQVFDGDTGALVGVFVVNLLFLAQTVVCLHAGCREARGGLAVLGSLMLAAWSLGRYVDMFHELWVRGLVFLILGAVLFWVGVRYARSKTQQKLEIRMSKSETGPKSETKPETEADAKSITSPHTEPDRRPGM